MNIVENVVNIYSTYIEIENYSDNFNETIEKSLSVWNDVRFKYDFTAYEKIEHENTKTLRIPTGYNIKRIYACLNAPEIIDHRNNEIIKLEDLKNYNCKINMKYGPRDEIQKRSLNFLNDNKMVKNKGCQKFLALKTGGGKTYCTVKFIVDNYERPIIFVDQKSLAEQWKERIMEYTDTVEDEIYYISGRPSINKLLKKTNEEINNIKFFLCCYRTITNLFKKEDYNVFNQLMDKIKITLKVYDEAHVEYRSIVSIDLKTKAKSLYLSATPKRTDYKENKVYQNMFHDVPIFNSDSVIKKKKDYKEKKDKIEDKNYHNIIIYNWNSHPTNINETSCQNAHGFNLSKYFNYLQNNKYEDFFNIISNVIFKVCLKNGKLKRKMAILIGTNSFIDKLYKDFSSYIENSDMEYKYKLGIFNGTVKEEDKLRVLDESDIILTTDKSFSKGMDVKNLTILINLVPFSSDVKLEQVIGRLRKIENKKVFFIDINDIGFGAIRGQLYQKKKLYEKIGKNIYEFKK